jgi:hypothetical protein
MPYRLNIISTSYADVGTYNLIMRLFDDLESTNYEFQVSITNSAPYFIDTIPNYEFKNNITISYALPTYIDNEGNSISILLSPALSWAKIKNNSLEISRPPLSQTGIHSMTLTISDG